MPSTRTPRIPTPTEKASIRHLSFRTATGVPGTVTGLPLSPWSVWSMAFTGEVLVYSAGRLHDPYCPTGPSSPPSPLCDPRLGTFLSPSV